MYCIEYRVPEEGEDNKEPRGRAINNAEGTRKRITHLFLCSIELVYSNSDNNIILVL